MRYALRLLLLASTFFVLSGCTEGMAAPRSLSPIVVNSPGDTLRDFFRSMTLRRAIAVAAPGQRIVFDHKLNGKTIALSTIGNRHTVLRGEVMGMRNEPSGPVSYLVGYYARDYGASALYAKKNLFIDASGLSRGITLSWVGGKAGDARVLAVYGDLTMKNVTITGGVSRAVSISYGDSTRQPWTLARGGGVAVWGKATLMGCRIYGNRCFGDFESSRDRGAFGGGLYANLVELSDCVISGNSVVGGGAAGGGVYIVGGATIGSAGISRPIFVRRCAITGNRISAVFCYGAGIYSDGGGIGRSNTLVLENCTIAHNLADPVRGLPSFLLRMGYWRGGGVYISNGSLEIANSTIVLNQVYGVPRVDDLSKQNLAGGISTTIGNAHAVEEMIIRQSIIVGNTVHEVGTNLLPIRSYAHDIFTGSLMHFISGGYNRFGVMDFSQILVPVGQFGWKSLSRRHYPKIGDEDGLLPEEVLDLTEGVVLDSTIASLGVNEGNPVPLFYMPRGSALDKIPTEAYAVPVNFVEYTIGQQARNNFLAIILDRIEAHYSLSGFADSFTASFENYLATVDADTSTPGIQPYLDPSGLPVLTLDGVQWYGPASTWPKELVNWPYIEFWHRLDQALLNQDIPGMGQELLGTAAWSALFSSGPLLENPAIVMNLSTESMEMDPAFLDQRGVSRVRGTAMDIGAIEIP